MAKRKVAVIVGSLRKGSFNLKMARALMKISSPYFSTELLEIGQLPLYDQDLDEEGASTPVQWTEFRQKLKNFEAVLFVTPEYNRSIPGALKNAIDVGSRPYGKSAWKGLPAAVVSVSPGLLGAFGANHILRQSLVFLNMPTMPSPEAYISSVSQLFGEDGSLTNTGTIDFMTAFMGAFASWVDANSKK
ncbi:MAG: NAD(P)H-dependent oxidoreductase [Brevinematales bacterium]|jgi:chromate reductase